MFALNFLSFQPQESFELSYVLFIICHKLWLKDFDRGPEGLPEKITPRKISNSMWYKANKINVSFLEPPWTFSQN